VGAGADGAGARQLVKEKEERGDDESEEDDDMAQAYDSDIERELEADAAALREQEPEDEHMKLAAQDRARADAAGWTTLVLPPSEFQPSDNGEFKPDEALSLDFVHGYRGWDCHGNLVFTITQEFVYFAASVAVIMDPQTRRQKHYLGPPNRPAGEIQSLALHPGGSIVATAERGLSPAILIWDISTLATLRELKEGHTGGVTAMAFSKDGKRLVSAGMDAAHTVMVWEWKNEKKNTPLCSVSLKTAKIFCLGYNPADDVIVAGGSAMIEFMRVGLSRTGQRTLEHLPGVFAVSNRATHDVSPTMLSVAFTQTEFSLSSTLKNAIEGLCLTGSDIGNIYLWKREEQMDMIVSAHKSSVYALASFVNGFCSGGKDGKVKLWNNDLEALGSFDICAAAQQSLSIRALDQKGGKIIIGTTSSDILLLDQDSGEVEALVRGHKLGAVHAVAAHPTKPLYASVGDDGVLKLWDIGQCPNPRPGPVRPGERGEG